MSKTTGQPREPDPALLPNLDDGTPEDDAAEPDDADVDHTLGKDDD